MSLIINAEIPAGPTVEEAITECVIFAQKNDVMVKTTINDIPMLISYGKAFGATTDDLDKNISRCARTFVNAYLEYCKQKNSEAQSMVNSIADAYEKAGFTPKNPWE